MLLYPGVTIRKMTTIDCHTHCYPKELHADPTAWAKIHNEL
ncbi:MAG: hypothetical protein ACI91V_000029, partial [Lentimonas sp.]